MQPGVAVTGTDAVGIALRHQRHPVGRDLCDVLRHTRPSVSETVPPLRRHVAVTPDLHALRDGTRRIGQHETDLSREIDLPDLPLLGT